MRFVLVKLLLLLFVSGHIEAGEKILLICGPSGVGKSTVISALKENESRFQYVKPFTTRPLREGEADKIHISYEEMLVMEASGELIALNHVHGNYYATPKTLIEEAFVNELFPVIDWPIHQVPLMREKLGGKVVVVYLHPSDLYQLEQQLALDGRDLDGRRFTAGAKELSEFYCGEFDSLIDLKIENSGFDVTLLAEVILDFYRKSCCSMQSVNQ